jgi:hypothetical protein
MSSKLVTALQVAGAILISTGLGIIFLPLGLIGLGVFSVLFGLALERTNAQ